MEGFKKQEEPFQEHALLNNYISLLLILALH